MQGVVVSPDESLGHFRGHGSGVIYGGHHGSDSFGQAIPVLEFGQTAVDGRNEVDEADEQRGADLLLHGYHFAVMSLQNLPQLLQYRTHTHYSIYLFHCKKTNF